MINRNKTILTVAVASMFLGASFGLAATTGPTNASGASKIASLLGDPVIAKGKGVEVKRSQLDTEMVAVRTEAAARRQAIAPEQIALFERDRLNGLIGRQLMLNRLTDADKAVGKAQFQKGLARLKTDNKLSDEEFETKLSTMLRVQGMTRAEWEKQSADQGAIGAMLERELKVSITDEAVKKFYDENPSRFEQPEMVRASHILLMMRDAETGIELTDEQKKAKLKKIQDIRKRAVAGEDFAKLAKEFTEDLRSKDAGGEITLPRGSQGIPPEFEAAAFSLTTNQVSDVITTQIGYHIIKLSEKTPAKVITLAEVNSDLKEALKSEEIKKQLVETRYLEKIQKEANVEILDEKLKAVELPDLNSQKTEEKPGTAK